MFLTPPKILFILTLISGTFISISSNSWLGAWMGLEINLLSFIPLMINSKNLMSTEASLKYFLTQALASSILLFSVILLTLNNYFTFFFPESNLIINLMINSTLLLKMGAAPFHFWFPSIMEGLSWFNAFILMTWQKIAPLILISYCMVNDFLIVIIISSVIIGSLGGLNQISLRKLMAYSSINHIGWMLGALMISENAFLIYFFLYMILSMSIVLLLNSFKMFYLNQTFSLSKSPIMKFCLFISLLSLGGLPPFLGFLPKWVIIQNMVENNQLFLITIMVTMSLITLYFYLRITYSAFMIANSEPKWHFNLNNQTNLNFSIMFSSIVSILGLFVITLIFNIF
uniref:NADH dehydrogenase subunit 2 n=1 Tax=Furcatopanorpa longihypovalva TaxID=2448095 RepID=UPI002551E990|nr:NADH dehydrogenase subunit 2 [Furcatopanorpa longihypovalva]WGT92136.1 NADH dehydrogenase subunit 2 [Furcatopanorpa longihypovalva]WGT92149.1 NADH dehydrogenase subunit 2 [Furcatopanorpa longihypovalva]WGT92162.1 NADH dehydrogenase subunit 2 [Furcatopanorpa longihypovalva]